MTEPIEQPSDEIAKLLAGRAAELKAQLEANQLDKEGLAEVRENFNQVKNEINELQKAENERQAAAEQKAILDAIAELSDTVGKLRTPSKADAVLGSGRQLAESDENFFAAVAQAGARDAQLQAIGKARLDEMGSSYQGV